MYEIKRIIKQVKKKRSKVKQKMKMILKWLCFVTISLLLVATTIGKSFANIYTTNVKEPHNSTVVMPATITTTNTSNAKNNSIYKDVMLEVGKIQMNKNIIVQEKKQTNSDEQKQFLAAGIDPPKFSFLHSSANLQQTQQPQIPYSPSSLSSYIPSSSATSLLLSSSSSVSNHNTNITNNLNGNNIISNDGPSNNFGILDLAKAMEKKLKNIRNVELGCSTVQVSYTKI